jgi:two-component system chemotaxis response regulator CheB
MAEKGRYELLIIGGSAGSLNVALSIIPTLTKQMNVSVIIIFHRKNTEDTGLLEMMAHRTSYTVREAGDKDELIPGVIYLAPPDYHVLVERDKTITLDDSEKVNYSRPSIDVTMQSAADVYGERLMCVLLSGANADGAKGMVDAKKQGACIVVQDPETAEVPFMPQSALHLLKADVLLNKDDLSSLVNELTR